MNLFPYLRQAFTVNAQIPFTEVAERRRPDSIASLAQALGGIVDERFGICRLSSFTTEMSKRVKNDIPERALVGEPFLVFERLAQN